MVILLLIIMGVIVVAVASTTSQDDDDLQPDEATNESLRLIQNLYEETGAVLVARDSGSGLRLRQGEHALWRSVPSHFSEERAHSRHVGASVRVTRGVRIGGGESHSIPTVQRIDTGSVILTNRRIVFMGEMRTVEVRHSQLDAMEFSPTALLLRKSGRSKTIYLNVSTGYAMVLGTLIEYMLKHDDWKYKAVAADDEILVHSAAQRQTSVESCDELDSRARVYAAFVVLMMNADGAISEGEEAAVPSLEEISGLDLVEALSAHLDGEGLSIRDALDEALVWPRSDREALYRACETVADSDERAEIENDALDGICIALRLTDDTDAA